MPTYKSGIFGSQKDVTIWVSFSMRVIVTIWANEGFRIEGIDSSFRIKLFVYNFQKHHFLIKKMFVVFVEIGSKNWRKI